MISLLKKSLREQTLSAVDLYSKTLNDIEKKSYLNAFVHVNRDGIYQAIDCQKQLQSDQLIFENDKNSN